MDRTAFPQYLRRPQASKYLAEIWGLQYAASTLGKMCALGTGPETHHCGRIALHTPDSLDRFARGRIRPAAPKSPECDTPSDSENAKRTTP
jgi:hypothetical protein